MCIYPSESGELGPQESGRDDRGDRGTTTALQGLPGAHRGSQLAAQVPVQLAVRRHRRKHGEHEDREEGY